MTREETQAILGILGTSFPQFGDMVHALRHPTETLRTYRDALEQVSFLTAKEVIADWASGKATPPAAYERDQTVAKLCRECRDRQSKQLQKVTHREEVEVDRNEVAKRRAAYQPVSGWLGNCYRRFLEKAELVKSGRMDRGEYLRFVDEVVAEEASKL